MLLTAFDKFEQVNHIEPIIKKYRKVRDHSCAHLDENSTVDCINKQLADLKVDELEDVYDKMLNMFNFICKNVFTLKFLSLPSRTPLYGALLETSHDIEDFYYHKPNTDIPKELSYMEIMRAIRRRSSQYDEAYNALVKNLQSDNEQTYQNIINTRWLN